MVRKADFSTGYQYIFARGIQDTLEITTFGGRSDLLFVQKNFSQYIEKHTNFDDEKKNQLQSWIVEHEGKFVKIDEAPQEIFNLFSEVKTVFWTKYQLPFIEEELKKVMPDQIPNWEEFSLNESGTYELDEYLEKKIDGNDASKYRFILGAVIYHQILYNRVLRAIYSSD